MVGRLAAGYFVANISWFICLNPFGKSNASFPLSSVLGSSVIESTVLPFGIIADDAVCELFESIEEGLFLLDPLHPVETTIKMETTRNNLFIINPHLNGEVCCT